MALPLPGGGYTGVAFTATNLDKFIPEIWSSEIIRARNSSLVMANYCKRIPDSMKRGDVLHVPSVGRLSVNPKISEAPVQLQNGTPQEFTFFRDRHVETSFMIEDIANIQSDYDARGIYTEEAGLALARDIDSWILSHRAEIKRQGRVVSGGSALSLANILTARLLLLQADVPLDDLVLVISPAQHASLLSITQFISSDFVNGRPVETGKVGSLYGIPVIVTNAIRKNATSGFRIGDSDPTGATPGVQFWSATNTRAEFSRYFPDSTKLTPWNIQQKVGGQHVFTPVTVANETTDTLLVGAYSAILCSKEWLAFWMSDSPKVESSREVLFQADAVVSIQYYGAKVYRPECAVVIETTEPT